MASSSSTIANSVVTNTTKTAMRPSDKRFSVPNYDIVQFAIDFLTALGVPTSNANVGAIVAWSNQESSGYNPKVAGGLNNPLNIVVTPGDGHSGQGGTQGDIADFPSPAVAVAAYVKFWKSKTGIVNALKTDAGIPAISGAVNSFYGQWGSGINFASAPEVPATGIPAFFTIPGSPIIIPTPGDIKGPVKSVIDAIPGVGPFFEATTKLAGYFNKLMSNWTFVLEFLIGVGMIVTGALIIMNDVGTKKAPEIIKAVATA